MNNLKNIYRIYIVGLVILTFVLSFSMFLSNAYAGSAPVTVVNDPDNPVPVTISEQPCGTVLKGLKRAHNTIENPEAHAKYDLVNLTGPGTFVSAYVRLTDCVISCNIYIDLIIDDEIILEEYTYEHSASSMNPFGIFGGSGLGSAYIGFLQPVAFESNLILRLGRSSSGGSIIGTVIQSNIDYISVKK